MSTNRQHSHRGACSPPTLPLAMPAVFMLMLGSQRQGGGMRGLPHLIPPAGGRVGDRVNGLKDFGLYSACSSTSSCGGAATNASERGSSASSSGTATSASKRGSSCGSAITGRLAALERG